jgi:hypothetical protein
MYGTVPSTAPGEVARLRLRVRAGPESCQPEVEDLGVAVLTDHDVLGLQVTVDDTGVVGHRERLRDLDDHAEGGLQGRFILQPFPERSPLDDLHDDTAQLTGFHDVMDGDDVGMVQSRGRLRFSLEAVHRNGMLEGGLRQELHGHASPETRILRLVDRTHPAFAEFGGDLVMRDRPSDHEMHPPRSAIGATLPRTRRQLSSGIVECSINLRKVENLSRDQYVLPFQKGHILDGLAQSDEASELFEEAYRVVSRNSIEANQGNSTRSVRRFDSCCSPPLNSARRFRVLSASLAGC